MENVQTIRIQVLAIIGSILLIFFIIELIRRKRLGQRFRKIFRGQRSAVLGDIDDFD
jgi:predicted protein tyrosine phosphatase